MTTKQATAYLFYNGEMVLVRNTQTLSPLYPLWEAFSATVENGVRFQDTVRQAIAGKIGVAPNNLILIGLDEDGNGLLLGSFSREEFPRIRFCGHEILGLGVFGFGEVSGPGFSHRVSVQVSSHFGAFSKYARGLGVSYADFGLKRALDIREMPVEML